MDLGPVSSAYLLSRPLLHKTETELKHCTSRFASTAFALSLTLCCMWTLTERIGVCAAATLLWCCRLGGPGRAALNPALSTTEGQTEENLTHIWIHLFKILTIWVLAEPWVSFALTLLSFSNHYYPLTQHNSGVAGLATWGQQKQVLKSHVNDFSWYAWLIVITLLSNIHLESSISFGLPHL